MTVAMTITEALAELRSRRRSDALLKSRSGRPRRRQLMKLVGRDFEGCELGVA